jgi:predicted Zn finger-like uncharacterized protein
MNVSCPDCRSIFRVDPAKVPPNGVRARCSVCSGIISIPAPTGQNTPASGNAFSHSNQAGPSVPTERAVVGPSSQRPVPPNPAAPRSIEAAAAPRPRDESSQRPAGIATAAPPAQAPSVPELRVPAITPPFRPGAPSSAATPFAPPAGGAAQSAQGFPTSAPSPFLPPSSRPSTPARPAATPSSSPTPTSPESGARRPLNPFLSKDPNQRAKRLARALVSDIITYHPAKHAEGLRDGTLKQLFREEIKKSFEEYIAQVGQPLAEGTTYFQEALNEVLGAGKKIF